jgi:tol-pal system protein YbgF
LSSCSHEMQFAYLPPFQPTFPLKTGLDKPMNLPVRLIGYSQAWLAALCQVPCGPGGGGMRQSGWLRCLVSGVFLAALAACNTSMLLPQHNPPPPAGTQVQAPAAVAPSPEVTQQLRTLEDKVRRLERRVAALEQCQRPPKAAPATPVTPRPAERAPRPAPPPPSGDKLYSEGMHFYRIKNYPAARDKFSQYLKSQPRGAKSAQALYYSGESFYQEKRYTEAKEEFNKLVVQHPGSILAPTALLRQAYSYQQLNQKAKYTETLKKLIQQYPHSPEAQEALKVLK